MSARLLFLKRVPRDLVVSEDLGEKRGDSLH